MRLQGNIDAAVNGGVSKYRKAFFTPEFSAANPSEQNLLETLASHIEEQATLLGDVLELHGQLATEPLLPLHDRLVELYGEMKDWMVKSVLMSNVGRSRVASIVNTPLPPVPRLPEQYVRLGDTEGDTDNCYHEVTIGEPSVTKIAPPLPPRGVKSPSPLTPVNDNYTHIPPALPSRLSTFQGSPPPLMRKLSGNYLIFSSRKLTKRLLI